MEQIRVDRFILLSFLVLIFASTLVAWPSANSATDTATRLAAMEQQAADAKSSADNAWMLTSSALVLMMTGPGLALFYGGLVRKKNVLATMMQSFAMMALISVLWALFGYSLAFGSGPGFIGNLHNAFLRGVGLQPDPAYSATIPSRHSWFTS